MERSQNQTGGCHALIQRSLRTNGAGCKGGIMGQINTVRFRAGQIATKRESVYELRMHLHFSTFEVNFEP